MSTETLPVERQVTARSLSASPPPASPEAGVTDRLPQQEARSHNLCRKALDGCMDADIDEMQSGPVGCFSVDLSDSEDEEMPPASPNLPGPAVAKSSTGPGHYTWV